MEAIHRDFAPKGVKFYYVYKALAHPELHGYVQPYTLEERLAHVGEAVRRLRTQIPWIVDPMDNRLKHAFGDRPNSEFIIDPEGKVVVKRAWCDPEALRKDLERLVGTPDTHTDPEDLDLGRITDTRAEGRPDELPRVDVPANMTPILVKPDLSSTELFYAKLRVEVERAVLSEGKGLVYFDLRLDPLYRVHWNNLVGPVRIELVLPDGGPVFESTELQAPQPDEESDGAPREFLVRVQNVEPGDQFQAVVHYAACSDEEGWCKILSQRYTVVFQQDKDAGRVIARGRRQLARPSPPSEDTHPSEHRDLLTCTVVGVNGNVLRVRDTSGATRSVRLLPGTRILRSGRPVERRRLKRGMRIGVFGKDRGDELWALKILVLRAQ